MRFLKIVSAVVLGLLLAAADYKVDLWIYVFSMLTASSLFLVSRQEPRMKWMALALYVVSVLVLIVSSFGTIFCLDSFVQKIKHKFVVRDYYTDTIYYRLFIPSILSNVDKVIYIDSDTVVVDDISKMYNIDLQDKIIELAREAGAFEDGE
jgi:hypothetical protein